MLARDAHRWSVFLLVSTVADLTLGSPAGPPPARSANDPDSAHLAFNLDKNNNTLVDGASVSFHIVDDFCRSNIKAEAVGYVAVTGTGNMTGFSQATCNDGVSNGDELGVDCGGSCGGCVFGCSNGAALNYNSKVTADDGSCIPKISGCNDPKAINFDHRATVDNGKCKYEIVGCTKKLVNGSKPFNYDVTATKDNGPPGPLHPLLTQSDSKY